MADNPLGEYLRARREVASPEGAGVRVDSARRVPGLRRDEVAMIAGISTEYYTRLEQGRDRRPSAQVLDALARALGLDEAGRAHLHTLGEAGVRRRRPPRRTERVRPGLPELLDRMPFPCWIEGRYLDILYANAQARALSPLFAPGSNLLRSTVQNVARVDDVGSDPSVRALVAQLRASAGGDPDDPRLASLVGELLLIDADFARAWARHDVQPPPASTTYRVEHSQAGPLELSIDKFRVLGAEEQVLVICHGAPGSPTDQALAFLASTTMAEVGTVAPVRDERPTR